VLRRHGGAGDRELVPAPVEHHGDPVSGREAVRLGEGLAHQDLVRARRVDHATLADPHAVQRGLSPVREGDHEARGGLSLVEWKCPTLDDTRVHRRYAVDLFDLGRHGLGGAVDRREDVGHALFFVVARARPGERPIGTDRRHVARDAARDDQRDRDELPLEEHHVAEELPRERGHHTISSEVRRLGFSTSSFTRPPESVTTRSARAAMGALCVMIATCGAELPVHASRWHSRARGLPVLKSSAPVGSSQRSTSGRFAIARAIATRCCSPPESCAGKWSIALGEADERERLQGLGSRIHRVVGDVGDEGHVLARGEARDQVVELEDEADVLAPVTRERVARRRPVERASPRYQLTLARRGHVEAAEDVEQRRFAAAGGAEQHDELAVEELEIDAAQRLHRRPRPCGTTLGESHARR
jgi:hypothetical protein